MNLFGCTRQQSERQKQLDCIVYWYTLYSYKLE